ncbi:MAG: hypothetical protein V2I33_26420, partial [Kangiellaceae bacterium]|nr:hypothetical protein [Kangiellaceae bacterium]
SAMAPTPPMPQLSRFTITDFETGDHLRIGSFRYFRDLDIDDLAEDLAEAAEDGARAQTRVFGRLAEEAFEDEGIRLTFVNRAEADRIETLLRLDIDRDGAWDHSIEITHAGLTDRHEDNDGGFAV